MLTGEIALADTALMAGAALYCCLAEQPARLKLDEQAQHREYKSSYPRAASMQIPLAMIGFIFGLFSYYFGGSYFHLFGCILIGLNMAFSALVLMPIDKELMAAEGGNARTKDLIRKWGDLHVLRTLVSVLALGCYFLAALLS